MSTAQELIDQGVEQGLEKGLERGLREGALRLLRSLLKEKFKLTSLPEDVDHRLSEATDQQLEVWGKRVLGAKRLGDVFGPGTPRQKRPGSGRKKR